MIEVDSAGDQIRDEEVSTDDPETQTTIGNRYKTGEGAVKSYEEAVSWYRKAAEQGHHGAFRDMGEMYWKGLGVSQNDVLACMWWRLAVMHGDEGSERLLSKVTAEMTSSSVIKSEKLAREWMQKNK